MVITGKWFCEQVGKVFGRRDLLQYNGSRFYEFPDVVMSYINMLYFAMVLRILRQRNCPSTISLYYSWHLMLNSNFIEPALHPDHLLRASRHGNVFCLDCGECYRGLSFTTPSYRSFIGNVTGNPWVSWELPVPVPMKTRIHRHRYG